MAERFEAGREFKSEMKSDYWHSVGDNTAFGGDLASDDGFDLNEGADDTATFGRHDEAGEAGQDLNEANDQQLDAILDNFHDGKWGDLSLEGQKQAMSELAGFVAADTGNINPPEIVFRDDMPDGAYGAYNPNSNTIEINVNMMGDPAEAADTITHEMWHAHQEQVAGDPSNPRAAEYQEGFDNYITADIDFEAYENQMVEAEARDYAQGFKNRLNKLKGAA